jgi:hypothetical protein
MTNDSESYYTHLVQLCSNLKHSIELSRIQIEALEVSKRLAYERWQAATKEFKRANRHSAEIFAKNNWLVPSAQDKDNAIQAVRRAAEALDLARREFNEIKIEYIKANTELKKYWDHWNRAVDERKKAALLYGVS